jgi:hypothetical protein
LQTAESNPRVKKGQLVVRRHAPWKRRLAAASVALLAIVVVYAVYEWGRFDAGYDRLAAIQTERDLRRKVEALETRNRALESQVASVDVSRKVESEAYAEVERTLSDLQAKVLSQDEELTFYRGIVSPEEGLKGLRIQRFEIEPAVKTRGFLLRLVLVQSLRQDRIVSGEVRIALEGLREGVPATMSLKDAMATEKRSDRLQFSFRYFENLEQEILLPDDFAPTSVSVEVRAARHDPIRQTFPWQIEAKS